MNKKFLFATMAATVFGVLPGAAQNTSPYWSLAGNSNASATASKLGTTNSIPLRLFTKNVERVRIDTLGYVGIGTTSPTSRLTVNTASGTSPLRVSVNGSTKIYVSSAGGLTVGAGSSAPANGLYVVGRVGIGTSAPSNELHVVGRGRFTNGLTVEESGIYSNHTTGNGVEGYGNTSYGYGLYGSAYNGVIGLGSNYGVQGRGNYGVYGTGIYAGVYGSASSYGVIAYGNNTTTSTGVYGSGKTDGIYGYTPGGSNSDPNGNSGVYGYNASTGYGTGGFCVGGSGIYGNSTNYVGVWGTTGNVNSWAGYFNGKVFSTGGFTTSDRKLKKDIADLSSAMDIISKLQPKSYSFRQDGDYKWMNMPAGKHYGLIAQDVEQILPELVNQTTFDPQMAKPQKQRTPGTTTTSPDAKSDLIDFKALNYTELIPIIIKGMQEQSALIEKQQREIEDLKTQLNRFSGNGTNVLTGAASLGTNFPNPARTSTRITYAVPGGSRAQLLLTDAAGKMIKSISLNGSGNVNLNTSALSSGLYNYSLLVDGKIVASRKMEVIR